MDILRTVKSHIPSSIFNLLQPRYHWTLSFIAALIYGFPSRKIKIVGVTGTKGKSTTVELVNVILEEAGFKTSISSTIRFKIEEKSERNMHKMTMPGRFFIQRLIRQAIRKKCNWVILEMTSEGVKQFRHKWINLDALIFTNLTPEHIESHGSFENYRDAKRELGKSLEKSNKSKKTIVANIDDKEGSWFLGLLVPHSFPFSIKDAEPQQKTENGYTMTFRKTLINTTLLGTFNLYNILAASTFAVSQNINLQTIKQAIEKFKKVRGRVEIIQKNPFTVVIDNAHTKDSLEKFYEIFKNSRNICVLGKMGGGRDKWSRTEMASVADNHCNHIILTNEDPVDEDPISIVNEMATAIKKCKFEIIIDRRQAIMQALRLAGPGDNVLITGKGTDPYILGPNGTKTPWDDSEVAREELEKLNIDNGKIL